MLTRSNKFTTLKYGRTLTKMLLENLTHHRLIKIIHVVEEIPS